MTRTMVAGSVALLLALGARPLSAQEVAADVVVRSGPVAGRVALGDYRRRERVRERVIVYERPVERRVVVVEPVRHGHKRHWRRLDYRPVVVYYVGGRYYDRYDHRYPRARRVIVYERGGRYYHDCDDDYRDHHDDHDHDHDHDRGHGRGRGHDRWKD